MIVPDDATVFVVTGPSGDVVETTCVVRDVVVVVGHALGDVGTTGVAVGEVVVCPGADSMVSLAALGSFRYW